MTGEDATTAPTAPVDGAPPAVIDSVAALFSAAEQLAPHVKINNDAAAYLYERTRLPRLSREQWEDEARLAIGTYRVMRGSTKTLPWHELIDLPALDDTFAGLRSASNASNGTLLLTFHGPFAQATQKMFTAQCEDGVRLGAEGLRYPGMHSKQNYRDALFGALNVLRGGGFVMMAPDGPCGRQSAEFKVLGTTLIGGGGAAFLAHASRCNTAWYTFVRNGDRLLPVIEAGPTRLDDEALAAFSDRLHSFYAKKIEDVCTGDPRNLKLSGSWMRALARASGQKAAREHQDTAARHQPRGAKPRTRKTSASPRGAPGEATAPLGARLVGAAKQDGGRQRRGDADSEGAAAHQRRLAQTIPRVDSVAALFSAARRLAPRQKINRRAMQYLFARSRLRGLSRGQWKNEARLAGSLYQIMRRSRRALPWEQVVNLTATEEAFAHLKSAPNASKGTLLLTLHGAATPLTQELFHRLCENGVILGGNRINRRGARSFDNSRDALFAAINELRDSGFVLMAPDGRRGQQTAQFSVLGATARGGAGAAFLAHAARCNTAWYTFVRDGDCFTPQIEAGPTRQDGESLAAFSGRLHDFYAKRVEAIYSGDPRNIMLLGRWPEAFALAARSLDAGRKGRNAAGLIGIVVALARSLLAWWRKPADRPLLRDRMRSGIRQRRGRHRHAMGKRKGKAARKAHGQAAPQAEPPRGR